MRLFSNYLIFFGCFDPENIFLDNKMNNCRGYLSDVLAVNIPLMDTAFQGKVATDKVRVLRLVMIGQ